MPKRSKKPLAAVYEAMLAKINEQFQDSEFTVRDFYYLMSDEIKRTDLSMALNILSRKGHIERICKRKINRVEIGIFRRIKNPVVQLSIAEKKAVAQQTQENMHDACMRLWDAFKMPTVKGGANV